MENVKGMRSLRRRLDAVGKLVDDETLGDWQIRTVAHAKTRHRPNKKTGMTSASIQPGRKGRGEAEVEAGGAAVFLEYGTKPHTIVPRSGRVLVWARDGRNRRLSGAARKGTKSGDLVFARKVSHPGTKPYPFLIPGAEQARDEVFDADAVVKRWNKAG